MCGARRALQLNRTLSVRPAEAGSLTSLHRKRHAIRSTRWSKRHRYRGDVRLRRIGRKRSLNNLRFTDGRKARFLGPHRERSRITPARAFCEIRTAGFNGAKRPTRFHANDQLSEWPTWLRHRPRNSVETG